VLETAPVAPPALPELEQAVRVDDVLEAGRRAATQRHCASCAAAARDRSLPRVEAIYGLLGVVVGALLQGGWSWWMERRREGWAAKKSGRLFGPALMRCALVFDDPYDPPITWGEIVAVVDSNLDQWPEHAEVFAGTLHHDEWMRIYVAVRELEHVTRRAREHTQPDEPVMEGYRRWLEGVAALVSDGAVACAIVGRSGVQRQRIRNAVRSVWYRVHPIDEDKLMREVYGDHNDDDTLEGMLRSRP
jgi:hypothetical protein